MADRQHHGGRRDKAGRRADAAHAPIGNIQIFHAAIESHFAAHLFDPLANCLHHRRQPVAAQVRSMFIENGGLALALGEQFKNPFDVRAGHSAGELAIAKGPRAAFAEKIVALW
jgi:hypothetical protein